MLKKEPFNTSKVYYEKALKRSGFRNIKNQEYQLWCSKGKAPAQYLYSNNINKIFNRSTVKVGYCCTQIVGSIVRLHYKQLVGANGQIISSCNCRKTKLYKCVLTQQLVTEKRIYLWPPGGGNFMKLNCSHKQSFNNYSHVMNTSLSKLIWELKKYYNATSTLTWHVV